MKTYLPKLLTILTLVCRYILKYNIQIKSHLPPTAGPAVDSVVEACQILAAIVNEEIPAAP